MSAKKANKNIKESKDPKKKDEKNSQEKKDKEEVKKDSNIEIKKEVKDNTKAIVKVKEPEKLTLLEKEEQKKNKNYFFLIILAVLIVLIMIFSTIFALMNVTKSVIINGVSVKGIDVSNLTVSEATKKITEAINIELNAQIKLQGKDYETTLNSSQIEFEYNIAKAVNEAYAIGRNGNIVQNNYTILFSALLGNEVEMENNYNEDALNYFVDDIESKMPGLVTQATFYREADNLIITPGSDGLKLDKNELKNKIIDTIKSESAVELLQNNTNLCIEMPVIIANADPIDVEKIREQIYTEPKDAYYEENPFQIFAEVEGVDFAISNEEAKQIVSKSENEIRIPLKITPANKTINDIGTEAFPYLISTFSTKYDASNTNRSQNLAIAAKKIDGTVLMPGEEFSFNQVVGKRTIEEGYKDAKIYQDGQVVDGLAGGICQISSTLYNAVVQANLEITERRNHSFTTSYVKAGMDATVVYGVIDFKFKNTRTYPVKINSSVNSGIAQFEIHGIKEEVEYDVKLAPMVTASIPYTTQTIPDVSLAPGQQIVVQSGGNGCKVTTYREVRQDGILISREIASTDTYNAMKRIVRVGP